MAKKKLETAKAKPEVTKNKSEAAKKSETKKMSADKKKSVLICIQLQGNLDTTCFTNLIDFVSTKAVDFDFDLFFYNSTYSSVCKNNLLSKAADSEFDYVFFWDPKILLDKIAIGTLMYYGKDVVSALFFGKADVMPNFWLKDDNGKYLNVLIFPRKKLLKVAAFSLGATLFKTSVLKQLKQKLKNKPFFDFQYLDKVRCLDEDLFFCKQLESLGIEFYLDSGLSLSRSDGYLDEGSFLVKYAKTIKEFKEKAEVAQKNKKSLKSTKAS